MLLRDQEKELCDFAVDWTTGVISTCVRHEEAILRRAAAVKEAQLAAEKAQRDEAERALRRLVRQETREKAAAEEASLKAETERANKLAKLESRRQAREGRVRSPMKPGSASSRKVIDQLLAGYSSTSHQQETKDRVYERDLLSQIGTYHKHKVYVSQAWLGPGAG